MQTEVKNPVKSAEQKLIESHMERWVSQLRSRLMIPNLEINIEISGIPLGRLGHMAECQGWQIDKRYYEPQDETTHYIRKPFSGEGYSIEEISE